MIFRHVVSILDIGIPTGNSNSRISLNNTALASPRILVPIVENNQQADGTIRVPEVLVSLMGKSVIS